jgi:small subunit ribosomal protein S8
MVGDVIGDFIIQLKNAGAVNKKNISVPYSKLRHAVADKLVLAGFVEKVSTKGLVAKKTLEVALKFEHGTHAIRGVKRISKPGRRLYTKVADIHRVKFGQGKLILSTPAGILTNDEARAANVGGEQLFIIW